MGIHAGLFTPKNIEELLDAIHLLYKRLMGQLTSLRAHMQSFKKKKNTKKDASVFRQARSLRQREKVLLQQIRSLFEVDMREVDVIERYGLKAEVLVLQDMRKDIRARSWDLVQRTQIPRATEQKIEKKIRESSVEITEDIEDEEQAALVIKRHGKSFKVITMRAMVRSPRGAARRGKANIKNAEDLWHNVNEIKKSEKVHEMQHDIDKIGDDLVAEVEKEEKMITYVRKALIYGIVLMEEIREELVKLKGLVKDKAELARIIGILEREWETYMSDISGVSRQVRFSVAPHKEGAMAAAA